LYTALASFHIYLRPGPRRPAEFFPRPIIALAILGCHQASWSLIRACQAIRGVFTVFARGDPIDRPATTRSSQYATRPGRHYGQSDRPPARGGDPVPNDGNPVAACTPSAGNQLILPLRSASTVPIAGAIAAAGRFVALALHPVVFLSSSLPPCAATSTTTTTTATNRSSSSSGSSF
jgi:hypothetical protein